MVKPRYQCLKCRLSFTYKSNKMMQEFFDQNDAPINQKLDELKGITTSLFKLLKSALFILCILLSILLVIIFKILIKL